MYKIIVTLLALCIFSLPLPAQEKAITLNQNSPHVKLKSINIGDCRWTEGFWADKFEVCEQEMVPYMWNVLSSPDIGHAYQNFKIAAGLEEGICKGTAWHDGDFYKWIEASLYVYAINKDSSIISRLDEVIAVIAKAQAEDGYLSTPVMLRKKERFSEKRNHEMYNFGHLFTTACIHHRVTGKTSMLDIATNLADYLYETFNPTPDDLIHFGWNPSHIMGLVELYRTTKDKRYLALAEIFINNRGAAKAIEHPSIHIQDLGDQNQDRTPLREEDEAVGHAVTAMYLYAGAADVYAETGEKALMDALHRIWDNVVNYKMYVTGAVGQVHHSASSNKDFVHEAFYHEYVLPNKTAYNETCANISNAMFNYRMLSLTGNSKYTDIMELVLYNSALSGISIDGKSFFYTNPLRRTEGDKALQWDTETRQPYLDCFCCPPNIVRTIAKSSAWAYSLSDDAIWVNLYGGNRLETTMLDGATLKLSQESNYPWDGDVKIVVDECKEQAFSVMMRIPEWCNKYSIKINGKHQEVQLSSGRTAHLKRVWKKGDAIELVMDMPPTLVEGHEKVEEIRNQIAIKRGPVVYCLESPDLSDEDEILDIYIPSAINLKPVYKENLLGGLTTLNGTVKKRQFKSNSLYAPLNKSDWKELDVQFIPYYAWSNRGISEMTVWMPILW